VSDDRLLSDVLSEFAHTLVTDFPIQGILDHLVQRIVDVLPISAAGVTVISPGVAPRYLAASNRAALRFEQLQTDLDEGPCLEAYHTGNAVAIADLHKVDRFPRFAREALAAGLVGVFTFPLRDGERRLGALDLYCDRPGPLAPEAMKIAQTLADVAAAYLHNAQARADIQDSADRCREMATHDSLTGLPNRTLLLERLEHAVLKARRSKHRAAVLFVDLDQFKAVNDRYGHTVGDELLVAVSNRMSAMLRPGDTVARISGDEFVILCEDLDDSYTAEQLAARVGSAIARPFTLSSCEVAVSASVGIAFSGRGDHLAEQVLVEADAAMYQAKRHGGAREQVLDLREQDEVAHVVRLERELAGAADRGEFRTEYQPMVDIGDGCISGVEALLRWDSPLHGAVAPTIFIPIAESCGLIDEIGQWVLRRSCQDRNGWSSPDIGDLPISVNISAHQLMSSGFADGIAELIDRTGADPTLLILELTEGVFVKDAERALVVLTELRRLGLKLALDDFGTGYSSLSYLKRFPINTVKIDQGFVIDMEHDSSSHAIVSAIITLAHTLGMSVVAEGVETETQCRELSALGCDACQGHYFAYPMPAVELGALLHRNVFDGAAHFPVLV
jgi:diguanylate cyclase (GGDEF)-like protein